KNFYALFEPYEKRFGKTIRNVHCPHGFSDKIFWLEQCVWEDITLIYGNNMLDMFRDMKIDHHLNAYVRTGNYRLSYYQKHQKHFDDLVNREILSRFAEKNRPIILYAPTCNDPEHATSFLDASSIFDKLPSDYNLLVKIHPVLEETDAPILYQTIGKYEKKN